MSSNSHNVNLPGSFAIYYPQSAKAADGADTFLVDVTAWTPEKVAAVFAFGLKEFANNRTGGTVKMEDGSTRKKTAAEIVELCVQKTFDDWTPGVGGGTRADPFVIEARIRCHSQLNMKVSDVAEATKGMDRDAIIAFMTVRVKAMLGADAKKGDVARVVANLVKRIENTLEDRASAIALGA